MICYRNVQNWIKIVILALTIILPTVFGNSVCFQCSNLPHPWDCNRVIQCNTHETCYVEQVVTISGVIVYNSGCASEQKCKTGAVLGGKRSVLYSKDMNQQVQTYDALSETIEENHHVYESPIVDVSVDEQQEDTDLTTCFSCCNNSYCNQALCDITPRPSHPNQKYCMSCSDVVKPSDCEYLVMCNPGEICYTEYMILNGEERYRMGCISSTACGKTALNNPSPSLVGKKRFVVDDDSIGFDKYCSKCCTDDVGNCNRELCDKSGTTSPGINVSELITPPERKDFCSDLFPASCPIVIIQKPELCKDARYAYYACREFCGTCVNPGHNTARPSTTQGAFTGYPVTPTKQTTQSLPPTDCFYDSNKYMGAYSTSITNKPCLNWSSLDPTLVGFPDDTITAASNNCRDPDKRGFPWCYTSDSFDWEFCPVPFCKECFYANESASYEGYVNSYDKNDTCDPWTDYVIQTGDTNVNFPNNSVADASNFCRDPKGTGALQCYDGTTLKSCDIGQCPNECRDDPNSNCALVQKFVCKSEYTSATLCPKTCNMCKFGLLPSVKVDPPADICVDNPDANCKFLQSIICSDPDGALKLCPKTCQKCKLLYGKSTVSPMTSPTTVTTQTTSPPTSVIMVTTSAMTSQPTTPTTTPQPYWLPWGSWICEKQGTSCFQRRLRNCSTGIDNDCITNQGGIQYNVGLCTETTCPEFFKTTPTTTTTTTPQPTTPKDPCQDDPTAIGCNNPDILGEVCKDKAAAWKLCRRSCSLCDSCWDYLNCTTPGAQGLFCNREGYALQYCRKTCGKCANKPVDVQLNNCGDPVSSEAICQLLQTEICICNDEDVRALCGNYCANKCNGFPYTGSTCVPARRKKRDILLNRLVF